ncbi:hypothetical protein ABPG75_005046 [Micractinium tetrahymenae]
MSRPAWRTAIAFSVLAITCWIVLDALSIVVAVLRASGPCQPDNEGSWAIGLFHGPSPLDLAPYPQQAAQQSSARASIAAAARPAPAQLPANPILTCASLAYPPSNFVADPFLWLGSSGGSPSLNDSGGASSGGGAAGNASLAGARQQMHVFFETKTNTDMQGDIAVARSDDGGASWRVLGVALDEPWHLSYPFVFAWEGKMYLLPEGHASGSLRLYVAEAFPLRWRFHSALLPRPMIDASMVQWQGRWYLFASDVRTPFDLELFVANSPLGPWQPHPLSPVQRHGRAAGARMAGRLAQHGGRLHRFGQDCGKTYGHQLVAYRIDELSPTAFRQARGPLRFGRQPWSAARHHHLDAQQLPDGSWLAVGDGDWQSSAPISGRLIRDAVWLAALWVLPMALWARARWAAWRQHHQRRGGGDGGGGSGTGEPAGLLELGMAGPPSLGSSSAGSRARGGVGSAGGDGRWDVGGSASSGAAKRQQLVLLRRSAGGIFSCRDAGPCRPRARSGMASTCACRLAVPSYLQNGTPLWLRWRRPWCVDGPFMACMRRAMSTRAHSGRSAATHHGTAPHVGLEWHADWDLLRDG